MSRVIQTILTVRPATSEFERSIAEDLTVEDSKDITEKTILQMSLDYNRSPSKKKSPTVVEEMGNEGGQNFKSSDDEGTL